MKEKTTSLKEVIEQFDVNKGGYIHFIGNTNKVEQEAIENLIDNFLGELVTIDCRKNPFVDEQPSFPNAIRVYGKLEKHNGQYRALFNDGCYSYFTIDNVIELGCYAHGKTFENQVKATIGIRF
jgi:hypothetical protein